MHRRDTWFRDDDHGIYSAHRRDDRAPDTGGSIDQEKVVIPDFLLRLFFHLVEAA